jgi:hypothetical protein
MELAHSANDVHASMNTASLVGLTVQIPVVISSAMMSPFVLTLLAVMETVLAARSLSVPSKNGLRRRTGGEL